MSLICTFCEWKLAARGLSSLVTDISVLAYMQYVATVCIWLPKVPNSTVYYVAILL